MRHAMFLCGHLLLASFLISARDRRPRWAMNRREERHRKSEEVRGVAIPERDGRIEIRECRRID